MLPMPVRLITPSQLSLFSISPVIGAWWQELKASSGFPISLAIEQSLVCASTEQTDDGLRVVQRPPTSRDFQLMAECLKELGFERDENPTGKERTRKWRFNGTDNTGVKSRVCVS